MPERDALPEPLCPLLRLNAIQIDSDADFNAQCTRLVDGIRRLGGATTDGAQGPGRFGRKRKLALAGLCLAAIGLGLFAVFARDGVSEQTAVPGPESDERAAIATADVSSTARKPDRAEDADAATKLDAAKLDAVPASEPTPAERAAATQAPNRPRARALVPDRANLERALLRCWKRTIGGHPDQPQSSIVVRISKSGETYDRYSDSRAFASNPLFERCVEATLADFWEAMGHGAIVEARLVLPGKPLGAPFPSEAGLRADVARCWREHEGASAETPRTDVAIELGGGLLSCKVVPDAKGFKACILPLLRDYSKRGSGIERLKLAMTLAGQTP